MFSYVDYAGGKPHCNFSGTVGRHAVHFASYGRESHFVWFDSFRVLLDMAAKKTLVVAVDPRTNAEEVVDAESPRFHVAVRAATWILFQSNDANMARVRRAWHACSYDRKSRS